MRTSSILEKRFREVVSSWDEITVKDYFDFVYGYGETKFFLDLWTFLDNDSKFKIKYANMVHGYFTAKKYFEEH